MTYYLDAMMIEFVITNTILRYMPGMKRSIYFKYAPFTFVTNKKIGLAPFPLAMRTKSYRAKGKNITCRLSSDAATRTSDLDAKLKLFHVVLFSDCVAKTLDCLHMRRHVSQCQNMFRAIRSTYLIH